MKKRYLALFVVFTLIFQYFPLLDLNSVSIAQSTQTPNYDGDRFFVKDPFYSLSWSSYKLDMGVPSLTPMTITIKGNVFYFNMELWEDQHIVVYGSYSSIQNDFKNGKGIEDSNGYRVIENQGYYENGTGEYRYHGFDQAGNKYANNNFPRDAVSKLKASEKQWIYQIWKQSSPFYSDNRIKEPSDYNKVALGMLDFGSDAQIQMKKVINDALPFEIVSTYNGNTNKDAFNYAHVQSMSTTLFGGEALMYHYRPDLATPIWYQVFSLEPTKKKLITPVLADIQKIGERDFVVGESAFTEYTLKVIGTLKDEHMWDNKNGSGVSDDGESDKILRATYYHRDDISNWTFTIRDSITNEIQSVTGRKTSVNTGEATVKITIPSSTEVEFLSVATSNFNTGEKSSDDAQTGDIRIKPEPVKSEPLIVDITAPNEMLDTEMFKISDYTAQSETFVRTVTLDGVELSETDADKFTSGTYTFPFIGEDLIYSYSIKYYDTVTKIEHNYINYVVVYTTKPKAQFTVNGTFKENRLIEAQTDISSVNSNYLRTNATINTNSFNATNLSGDNSLIKYGTQNQSNLAFIVKGTEEIQIQMQVTAIVNPAKIERSDIPVGYHTSDVFNYRLYTQEDYAPAMIANVWNSTLTRNEKLDLTYDASSVDNDTISISTYKIYFDSNGDKIPETIVKQGNYSEYTPYSPTSLGYYKIVFYAEETFGQLTLSQFITASDKRTAKIERDIFVDNLAPMTKLYTDIEYDFPEVDVIVLNDQDITRERNNSIVSERVNWINGLRQSGMSASVQVWDLHTYVYSQTGSTTLNTGSSTPPSTTFYSSGGYSGTIGRYNIVNNQYQVDNGYYTSQTTSQWCDGGSQSQSGTGSTPSTLPSSVYYNDGFYSGSLGQTSYDYDSWPIKDSKGNVINFGFTRTATYGGTLSRTVQVWQSNYVWRDDYTGYYSGTIYKNVKHAFVPSYRINSNKYIVYFADSNVNNKADIESIKLKGTAKVILVGNSAIKSQYTHDYYISGTLSLFEIMNQVNTIIADANPTENKQTVLLNEVFALTKSDYDDEGDSITDIGYEYVQDANYYDNSMGLETGAVATYSDSSYTSTLKSSFTKVGHYKVFRKIKDIPTGYPSYTKDSNVPQLDIYVHRKPIADFTLDWDYVSASSTYKTTWVDKSYDLDHQFTDPQKGIVERKIMYRKTSGDNLWVYAIPDNLTSGTYELRYTVKDLEGAWSDETTKLFTLSSEPPIQLKAKLKSITPPYETSNIPASEKLQVFEIITNYHQAHNLKVSIYDDHGIKLKDEALLLSLEIPYNSIKGNIYNWKTCDITLPQTYQDGYYSVKIEAYSVINPAIKTIIDLPFHVQTPIDIVGDVDAMILGEISHFTAKTNKYASTANVILYKGTAYQTKVALKKSTFQPDSDTISWENDVFISESVTEGNYILEFEALTASNNRATYELNKEVMALKVKNMSITGYWNHWRGQIDVFGERMSFEPHRFLSYEKVIITAEVIGDPDEVSVSFSPELEAMSYTNSLGQVYLYQTEVGFVQIFPIKLVKKSGDSKSSNWEGEYVLPLAKETISWQNLRLRPSYQCSIIAKKALNKSEVIIDDIEITGNIYDLLYHQPKYKN